MACRNFCRDLACRDREKTLLMWEPFKINILPNITELQFSIKYYLVRGLLRQIEFNRKTKSNLIATDASFSSLKDGRYMESVG